MQRKIKYLAFFTTLLLAVNTFATEEQQIKIRKSQERGNTIMSWLDSKHTFSFGSYYDPTYMGYGVLRVINDDRVIPGAGFATHSHNDMEIISYVLDGELAHKDSMGNGSIIKAGELQRMSAGSGVTHSEYNPSQDKDLHFLQIWIQPNAKNIQPSYEQQSITKDDKLGKFKLVASGDKASGAIHINQDLNMYIGALDAPSQSLEFKVNNDRKVWVHIATGEVLLNNEQLNVGDGVAISGPATLSFTQSRGVEIFIFEMA